MKKKIKNLFKQIKFKIFQHLSYIKIRNFLDRIIGGDFDSMKHTIKKHCNLDHPDGNGVNKRINGVKPADPPPQPPQPQQPQQPKLLGSYPSETFQG